MAAFAHLRVVAASPLALPGAGSGQGGAFGCLRCRLLSRVYEIGYLLETVQEPLQGACMGLNASEEPVGHSRDLLERLPVQPARFIRSF